MNIRRLIPQPSDIVTTTRGLRRYMDVVVASIVAALGYGGAFSFCWQYVNNMELPVSPYELALVCTALGGFILVFRRHASVVHLGGCRLNPKWVGKLYLGAAIAFVLFGLMSPWLTSGALDANVAARWLAIAGVITSLTVAALFFAFATSLVVLVLWEL